MVDSFMNDEGTNQMSSIDKASSVVMNQILEQDDFNENCM